LKGFFISLEGTEGAGKTTQLPAMTSFLKEKGYRTVVTREPGGCELGRNIRAILLDPENSALLPLAELFLYLADRAQHVQQTIRPALDKGKIVICDRYADATIAYQGKARGLGIKRVTELNNHATEGLLPDLTFLFDLPVEVGLGRAMARIEQYKKGQPSESRFEMETLDFHNKVRNGYLDLADQNPERYVILDAALSSLKLERLIRTELEKRIK